MRLGDTSTLGLLPPIALPQNRSSPYSNAPGSPNIRTGSGAGSDSNNENAFAHRINGRRAVLPSPIAHNNGISSSLSPRDVTESPNRSGRSRDKHQEGRNRRHNEELIEVQILPQDDNWGDNTTCITGATSDRSISPEDVSRLGQDQVALPSWFRLQMWLTSAFCIVLCLLAFLSPILMVLLPKWDGWKVQACGPECDGLLMSFAFKLCILLVGTWAMFFRRPRSTLPRIFVFRAAVLALVVVFLFAYWLFFATRIYERRAADFEITYASVVQYALSLVDTLLFIHYLALILMELRQQQPQYYVKVLRSPDGLSKSYTLGQLSIQRAAVVLLERYYNDFAIYNPFLETLPTSGKSKRTQQSSTYKVYDLNGRSGGDSVLSSTRSTRSSHNERFYEEHEYERRVRKRRARLISAAEESFTHIKRVRESATGPALPMDPMEAAQAIFPSMARPLQKYLRITRQQPRHTMQGILEHLAQCLHYDMSPKSFLEKYLHHAPVLQDDRELQQNVQSWALVCDILLSRPIKAGVSFVLRQGDVSLLVTVSSLPHYNLIEEVVDPKSNQFVLRLQSETSV